MAVAVAVLPEVLVDLDTSVVVCFVLVKPLRRLVYACDCDADKFVSAYCDVMSDAAASVEWTALEAGPYVVVEAREVRPQLVPLSANKLEHDRVKGTGDLAVTYEDRDGNPLAPVTLYYVDESPVLLYEGDAYTADPGVRIRVDCHPIATLTAAVHTGQSHAAYVQVWPDMAIADGGCVLALVTPRGTTYFTEFHVGVDRKEWSARPKPSLSIK